MRPALALLALILSGCTASGPGMRPDTDYHVRTPEQIAALACRYKIHNCRHVGGLAFWKFKPCEIYVPPLTSSTAWIWKHEERHCDEGNWHVTRSDK